MGGGEPVPSSRPSFLGVRRRAGAKGPVRLEERLEERPPRPEAKGSRPCGGDRRAPLRGKTGANLSRRPKLLVFLRTTLSREFRAPAGQDRDGVRGPRERASASPLPRCLAEGAASPPCPKPGNDAAGPGRAEGLALGLCVSPKCLETLAASEADWQVGCQGPRPESEARTSGPETASWGCWAGSSRGWDRREPFPARL